MNITSYCQKSKVRTILMRSATLNSEHKLLIADEYFYEFIGSRNVLFTDIVHHEDVELYKDAVTRLDEENQHILIRIINTEKLYRYYAVRLWRNGLIEGDAPTYDISIMDIEAMGRKYEEITLNLTKYRRYLGGINVYYFEYDIGANEFKIYTYVDENTHMIVRQDFDEFSQNMLSKYIREDKYKNAFNTFATYVREGIDNFVIQFNSSLLSRASREDKLIFKGSTLYHKDKKHMVLGTLTTANRLDAERAYYLTDAAKDSATGLFNKRAIREYASEIIRNSRNDVAIIVIDIDNFKNVNDTYGHLFGDDVISRVSDCIKSILGNRGVLGRFGGDEFMIILEKVGTDKDISVMLDTISGHIAWLYRKERQGISLSVSMGIAKFPSHGDTYEELFYKADKALYMAKKKGKDCYVFYDDETCDGEIADSDMHKDEDSWCNTVSGSVLKLHKNGVSAIPGVLKKICDISDVSAISIFEGDNLENTYVQGEYNNLAKSLWSIIDESYFKYFDSNNVWVVNDIEKYLDKTSKILVESEAQDIKAHVHLVMFKDNKPRVVINYDVMRHSYQWTAEEVDALVVIGRMIGQVLMEQDK